MQFKKCVRLRNFRKLTEIKLYKYFHQKRNITWFNPPYNKNVITKIGHKFLHLITKHFPKQHKFNKIFNRNTVKVSYSCTKNIKSIIQSHNKNILHKVEEDANQKMCNCRVKELCPLTVLVKLNVRYTKQP